MGKRDKIMSQGEVLKILRRLKENEWIGTTELVKIMKIGRSTIHTNLRKLRNSNDIVSRRTNHKHHFTELEHKLYHCEDDYETQ